MVSVTQRPYGALLLEGKSCTRKDIFGGAKVAKPKVHEGAQLLDRELQLKKDVSNKTVLF